MRTMREVAERAGVSSTTVSMVLNGRHPAGGSIPEQTRDRVLLAAKELGYRRNALAQAVISGRNKALGFLGPSVAQEFTGRLLNGALEVASAAGYTVQILRLPNSDSAQSDSAQQAFEVCLERRLAGLMLVDPDKDALDYLYAELKPHGVPLAFLDTSFREEWGVHVASDDMMGGRLAIGHLYDLGHRRIAFIGGDLGRGMANVRADAYRVAMAEHGLDVPEEYVQESGWSPVRAEQQTHQMLLLERRPTAIFCASDDIAIGVQRAARLAGLLMPRDLSVVGFADIRSAILADPVLTTISQPVEQMGRVAAQHLIERLEAVGRGEAEAADINQALDEVLPTHLVLRKSTAPPRFLESA